MDKTEDYLDHLLQNMGSGGNLQEESQMNIVGDVAEDKGEMSTGSAETVADAGKMSPEDIAALFAANETTSETAVEEEPKETNTSSPVPDNGMMSAEEIAALFASNEEPKTQEVPVSQETEKVPEPVSDTGKMSPEDIAALFAANETTSETAVEEEPKETNTSSPVPDNGMMSAEEIAALLAANEDTEVENADIASADSINEISEDFGMPEELSIDDMLAGMREEESIIGEDPIFGFEQTAESEPSDETSSEDDSILDLLNMMSEDEDLKDIGDLLKESDSAMDLSEDELFGEPSMSETTELENVVEQGEKEKKPGFFARLFGKKKETENVSQKGDENEQIIKEVEEEIKEEEKKAEEKKRKKQEKKDKKKKDKKGKAAEEGEEDEVEAKKKEKKPKKKKEKPPKEIVSQRKEPPLPKKPVILILLMAASILALVLISHNFISYQSSISKADSSFIKRNYEEAFQNILGVEVKEQDKELYDRIRIMMKLEAKYNMYLAHIECEQYDEALNDLIMGVVKYKQYAKDANELGITQAFEDEYALIVEQMNLVYGVDPEQAADWYYTLSALDYSQTIRSVVKAAGYSVSEDMETEDTDNFSEFGIEAVE